MNANGERPVSTTSTVVEQDIKSDHTYSLVVNYSKLRSNLSRYRVIVDAAISSSTTNAARVPAIGIAIYDDNGQPVYGFSTLAKGVHPQTTDRLEFEALLMGLQAASEAELRNIELLCDNHAAVRRMIQALVLPQKQMSKRIRKYTALFDCIVIRTASRAEIRPAHCLAQQEVIKFRSKMDRTAALD